jgi:hypothetical protein
MIRTTIRFNDEEEAKLKLLKQYVYEDDMSKLVKFAIDTALHHLNFVTNIAVSNKWDVIFTHKRKTQEVKRKIYDAKM